MREKLDRIVPQMDTDGHDGGLLPEERLLVAIFDRALRDLLCPGKMIPRHETRAARKYFSSLSAKHIGSFGYFCLHFGFNPKEVRKKVFSREGGAELLAISKSLQKRRYGG